MATFTDVNGGWVTLATELSNEPLSQVRAACNPDPGTMPGEYTETCVFFGFRVTPPVPGDAVEVSLILHTQDPSINHYCRYGPTPDDASNHWYGFMYNTDTGATISQETDRTIITMNLVDGGPGDDDLTANGEIVDVGGPVPTGGGGGGGGSYFLNIVFSEAECE